MEFLNTAFLDNSIREWALALIAGTAAAVALRVVVRAVVSRLAALAKSTDTDWDDLVTSALAKTKGWFLLLIAVLVGAQILTLSDRVRGIINDVVTIAFLIQAGIWLSTLLTSWLQVYRKKELTEDPATVTTVSALGFVGKIILWAVVVLLALDNLGVNITALVAGLSIGGVAVAFALQNILGDLFSSLSIVLDKPFVLGDFLKVDEQVGNVEHIGLKTTRVRALSGEQLVFSNSDLLGSRIQNFGRMFERRIAFTIGVTYQTTQEQLAAIPGLLKAAVEAEEHTRFDRAHWTAYGAFSLDFECVYYVTKPDFVSYRDAQQAINHYLFEQFAKRGIEFAYPTQTIFLAKEES